MRAPRLLVAVVPVVLVVAACSGSSAVRKADVETHLTTTLEQGGVAKGSFSVACPGDLAATVGTTMTCEVTKGTKTSKVLLTVTSTAGGKVDFDVSDAPAS